MQLSSHPHGPAPPSLRPCRCLVSAGPPSLAPLPRLGGRHYGCGCYAYPQAGGLVWGPGPTLPSCRTVCLLTLRHEVFDCRFFETPLDLPLPGPPSLLGVVAPRLRSAAACVSWVGLPSLVLFVLSSRVSSRICKCGQSSVVAGFSVVFALVGLFLPRIVRACPAAGLRRCAP